ALADERMSVLRIISGTRGRFSVMADEDLRIPRLIPETGPLRMVQKMKRMRSHFGEVRAFERINCDDTCRIKTPYRIGYQCILEPIDLWHGKTKRFFGYYSDNTAHAD
ncbi:MAG: hypothetical protein MN733_16905, partial [Nitrososphaera sp.]|nr:hypothetical protein [Nitrososphaera sp.]